MRASSARSHHSDCAAPGVNDPLIAKPSAASLRERHLDLGAGSAIEPASAAAVTGPRPCRRPRTISTSASSRDHGCAANSVGRVDRRRELRVREHGSRTAAGARRRPTARCGRGGFRIAATRATSRAFASASAARNAGHGSLRAISASVTKPSPSSASCSSSALAALGPRFRAHALDRRGVEPAQVRRRSSSSQRRPSPPACGAPRAARRRGTRTAAR